MIPFLAFLVETLQHSSHFIYTPRQDTHCHLNMQGEDPSSKEVKITFIFLKSLM